MMFKMHYELSAGSLSRLIILERALGRHSSKWMVS